MTTAYMAQGWSWEGWHRSPDRCEAVLTALAAYRPQMMTDLRVQIRAETHLVSETARLIEVVRQFGVGYGVFNDHLGEGFKMLRSAPAAFEHWARKVGNTSQALAEAIEAAGNQQA